MHYSIYPTIHWTKLLSFFGNCETLQQHINESTRRSKYENVMIKHYPLYDSSRWLTKAINSSIVEEIQIQIRIVE